MRVRAVTIYTGPNGYAFQIRAEFSLPTPSCRGFQQCCFSGPYKQKPIFETMTVRRRWLYPASSDTRRRSQRSHFVFTISYRVATITIHPFEIRSNIDCPDDACCAAAANIWRRVLMLTQRSTFALTISPRVATIFREEK